MNPASAGSARTASSASRRSSVQIGSTVATLAICTLGAMALSRIRVQKLGPQGLGSSTGPQVLGLRYWASGTGPQETGLLVCCDILAPNSAHGPSQCEGGGMPGPTNLADSGS